MALPPLPEPSKKFVSPQDLQFHDFSATSPLKPGQRRQMIHTPFVGACSTCNLTASLDVDPIDYKTLERVLEGRVVKAVCGRCRKETEFRPLKPEEIAEEQFWLLKRQLEIKELIFSAAARKGVDVPTHVQGAVEEYMKRLGHRLDRKSAPGEVRPVENKLIVPE